MWGPWLNFGLILGEDEPTNDNVIPLPEAVFKALPDSVWRPEHASDELPEPVRELAWNVLGRDGPAPKMRLAVKREVAEAAEKRVIEEIEEIEQQIPVVVRVQAKLDSYTTNKQRKQRIKELDRLARDNGGYMEVPEAIESFALMYRLELGRNITAKEAETKFHNGAIAGAIPLTVNIDGQRVTIPQEVIRRSIRH
jgi:hypothetical protein